MKRVPNVGPLERVVMELAFDARSPVSVREMRDALADRDRVLSHSAVKAVMLNLTRKRLLTKQRVGRSNVYRPACARREFEDGVVSRAMSVLLRNFRGPLLAHLAEHIAADEATIHEFERLLEKKKQERQ